MAAVTRLGTQTFNTSSGTKTVTATPAVGDLIVIITAHTGNTSSTAPTDNQTFQPGYNLINSAVKATSADTMRIWIRRGLIGSASSTVFSHAPGTSSGGGLAVFKVTGMGRVGSRAARQSAIQSNQAGGGTPTPVFGSAALTGNAVIGAVFNATNPATMTARGTPAYTERFDTGYATPTTGLETMSIDSGETGTSIAWGSTSGSAFASLALELDASAEDVNLMGEDQTVFDTPLRNKLVLAGLLTLSSPLTLTSPPVQSTDVPRSPVYFSVYQKPLVTPFQPPNLLTSTLAPVQALPFVSQSQEPVPPRKPSHWVWEPVQNTLLQVTLPNIGSTLDPAPEPLFPVYDSSFGSNPALFPVEAGPAPFLPPDSFSILRRKELSGPFFPARAIDPGPPATVPFFSPVFEYSQRKPALTPDTSRGLLPPEAAPPAENPFVVNLFGNVSRKAATPQDFLLTQFLPSRDLQPIASMQWLDSAPAKPRGYSNTSLSSPNIPAAAPGEPPGIPEHFDRVTRKADYRDSSASSPRVLLATPVLAPFVPIDFSNLQTRLKVREVSFPNLLHSTLDLPPIASSQSEFPSFIPRWLPYSETSLSTPETLREAVPRPIIPPLFEPQIVLPPVRDTSASSPRILLDTEVFKPFAEIVWPNAVRRSPLYNLAFDSFFSPDKIPEPPPPPPRVEITGGGPKKRTKSAKEELREILDEPKVQALVPADPAPELPKPLKPAAKVVIVPEYNPPIVSIPIDQPIPAQKVKPPPDEAEIAEIRLLISLGLL